MKLLKTQKFNTLKTKVNNLEKKIPDATNLIHTGDADKKYQIWVVYWL